jgi:hypothetical protein
VFEAFADIGAIARLPVGNADRDVPGFLEIPCACVVEAIDQGLRAAGTEAVDLGNRAIEEAGPVQLHETAG